MLSEERNHSEGVDSHVIDGVGVNLISREEIERELEKSLEPEPWYKEVIYKVDRALWRVYNYSRSII